MVTALASVDPKVPLGCGTEAAGVKPGCRRSPYVLFMRAIRSVAFPPKSLIRMGRCKALRVPTVMRRCAARVGEGSAGARPDAPQLRLQSTAE